MDPYSVLGLQRDASVDDAKTAFKKLAKTCHPDLHPNDPNAEKRFKEINEAFDQIKNGNVEQPFHGFSFKTGNFDSGMFGFEDIFANIRARQQNSDLHLECRISLEDAFHGKELNVQIPSNHSNRTVKVNIPAGVRHGMRLHIPRGGNQTNMSLPAGDLYMVVSILPHSRFNIENGSNLVTTVPVTVFDVLLGKEVEVQNIEGKILKVAIPDGFDSARKLRLAGQGMPDPRSNSIRGDLLVELFITYPILTDEQKTLIEQINR